MKLHHPNSRPLFLYSIPLPLDSILLNKGTRYSLFTATFLVSGQFIELRQHVNSSYKMVQTQKVLAQFCLVKFFTIAIPVEVKEIVIDGNAMQTQVQLSKIMGRQQFVIPASPSTYAMTLSLVIGALK